MKERAASSRRVRAKSRRGAWAPRRGNGLLVARRVRAWARRCARAHRGLGRGAFARRGESTGCAGLGIARVPKGVRDRRWPFPSAADDFGDAADGHRRDGRAGTDPANGRAWVCRVLWRGRDAPIARRAGFPPKASRATRRHRRGRGVTRTRTCLRRSVAREPSGRASPDGSAPGLTTCGPSTKGRGTLVARAPEVPRLAASLWSGAQGVAALGVARSGDFCWGRGLWARGGRSARARRRSWDARCGGQRFEI